MAVQAAAPGPSPTVSAEILLIRPPPVAQALALAWLVPAAELPVDVLELLSLLEALFVALVLAIANVVVRCPTGIVPFGPMD